MFKDSEGRTLEELRELGTVYIYGSRALVRHGSTFTYHKRAGELWIEESAKVLFPRPVRGDEERLN